jgi:hypothetical protein
MKSITENAQPTPASLPVVQHARYDVLPSDHSLRTTAMRVGRSGEAASNNTSDKRVVWIFLPGMDPAGEAYAAATVTKYGARHMQVNGDGLGGTRWVPSPADR